MRFKIPTVKIRNVLLGGSHPIVIQSMTNTNTADAKATAHQCMQLADAGAKIVRVTVNDGESAKAIPEIRKTLDENGYKSLPIVGDFHFNGHELLRKFPKCAKTLDKYRINPGNVGIGKNRDRNFETFIRTAIQYKKPIRIGVNWGSLDRKLLTDMMNKNAKRAKPKEDKDLIIDAVVESAIQSAKLAESLGLPQNHIVLSVKMARLDDMVKACELLAKKTQKHPYALHLGLTEAGAGMKGITASSAALAILLRKGIGDTIRVSLTPTTGHPRTEEVEVCKNLLQALDLRHFRPCVTSCPGCGRTDNDKFQKLAKKVDDFVEEKIHEWQKKHKGIEKLKIAVMGCVVNGPGESMHSDIGISLPGKNETSAQVFMKGKFHKTLHGNNIERQFLEILEKFISHYPLKNVVSSRNLQEIRNL